MLVTLNVPVVRRAAGPCYHAAPPVEVKVLSQAKAVVRYLSSDESVDRAQEVVRQAGWTNWPQFYANPVVVDCHEYGSSKNVIGRVLKHDDARPKQLFQDVEFAVERSALAADLFGMVEAGFLKGCSVGFKPLRMVSRMFGDDAEDFAAAAKLLGLNTADAARVRTIYLEQQQIELSTCPLGANPNALVQNIAKAYAGGALSDEGLERVTDAAERAIKPFPQGVVSRSTGPAPAQPADGAETLFRQERELQFLRGMHALTNR